MEFTSEAGAQRFRRLSGSLAQAVIGFDFDGTLAEIVPDPAQARIHPDLPAPLVDLAARIAALAVITGRPAEQAIALGGLEELGDRILARGGRLVLLGHYGNERWDAGAPQITSPEPPGGLSALRSALPGVLAAVGASDVHVEEKGLAIAVHTRRSSQPQAHFERLLPRLAELAAEHQLTVEPGRLVVEIRAAGVDKGAAVRQLAAECQAQAFAFGGDDLGDLPAFDALDALAAQGLATLRIGVASGEQTATTGRADVLVQSPADLPSLIEALLRG